MARLLFQLLALQLVLIVNVFGLFGSSQKIHGSKFKIQQKVLTLGSSFTIKDDKDKPVYKVIRIFFLSNICIQYFFRLDLKK